MAKHRINWQEKVSDLIASGMSQREIAERCGIRSSSTLCEISKGITKRMYYEEGRALLKLHQRRMRRVIKKSASLENSPASS